MSTEFFFFTFIKFLAPLPFYQKIAVGAMSGNWVIKC